MIEKRSVPGLMKHGVPLKDAIILLVVERPKSAMKMSNLPVFEETRIFLGFKS
jgi:hypothetical protein